jgi:hypothetical protein
MNETEDLKKIIQSLQKTIEDQQKQIDRLKPKPRTKTETSTKIREAFTIGYCKRFGYEYPMWGAKENSLAKTLLTSCGLEKSLWLINWYLVWTDPFVTQAGHPFGLLITNLVKMEAQLQRKGRYFDQVAQSKAMKKVVLDERLLLAELTATGEARARQKLGQQISFGTNGELPDETNQCLSDVSGRPADGQGIVDSECKTETSTDSSNT